MHFYVSGAGYPAQEPDELQFEDDPKVGPDALARSRGEGRFGGVRPIARGADRVWRCTFDMKLHR